MPLFMNLDFADLKGEAVDPSPGQHSDPGNVEVIVKVLDSGRSADGGTGATTDVEYTLTVTDTQTGNVTERESGLIYSGESGGMNEASTGSGHYTQLMRDGTNAATGDQLGKPKFEDIKLTMGVAGDDGEPGGLTSDGAAAADGSYLNIKMPDVLVSSWQTSAAEAGPFFAFQPTFRGGVDVPAGSSGHAQWIEVQSTTLDYGSAGAQPSGGGFIIFEAKLPDPVPNSGAAEAAGPMNESMETMKKAWKDASSTPEGKTADQSAAVGYDYDAIGRLRSTTDAAGGSWPQHGTILTGNPPDAERQAILKMLTADYTGDGDPSAAHWHAGGVSWGLDRIDQHVGGGDLSDWQSNYGTGGWDAAPGGGGGTGKVSVHDISVSTGVPKAAEHDTVELVTFGFSFDKIDTESGGGLGADDLALFDTDAAAPGNTYQGMTTIEQGVLAAAHSTMTLSFQYYIW